MEHFWTFLLFCVTSSVTPGPNNIMLMTSAMNFGIKKTLPHFIGVVTGFAFFLLILGLGLGILFLKYSELHEVIKTVGALYLLYLSWKIATSHTQVKGKKMREPISFIQGFLFQWINPKCWVMGISTMSAYTTMSEERAYTEVFIIVVTYFIVFIPSGGVWLLGGVQLRELLKNDRSQAIFNYVMGGALALSVIPIFF